LKTFDFPHSAAAHLNRSHGTLVRHGTQVGKHCLTLTLIISILNYDRFNNC